MIDIAKQFSEVIQDLRHLQEAYYEERRHRHQAEEAATFLYEAMSKAENEGDIKRALREADKLWPWVG